MWVHLTGGLSKSAAPCLCHRWEVFQHPLIEHLITIPLHGGCTWNLLRYQWWPTQDPIMGIWEHSPIHSNVHKWHYEWLDETSCCNNTLWFYIKWKNTGVSDFILTCCPCLCCSALHKPLCGLVQPLSFIQGTTSAAACNYSAGIWREGLSKYALIYSLPL